MHGSAATRPLPTRTGHRLLPALVLALGLVWMPARASALTAGRPLLPPLTPDGVLHSLAGTMSAVLVASLASQLYPKHTLDSYPLLLPALGFSAALTAGIGKEALDSTGFGDPQWSDILHTLLGGLAGAAFIAAAELTTSAQPAGRRANEGMLLAAVGVSLAVPVGTAFVKEIERYLHRRRSKA